MNTVTGFQKGVDDAFAHGVNPKAKDAKKVLREVSKIANLAHEEAKLVSLAVGIWDQPLPPNERQRRLDMEVLGPLAKLPRASRLNVVRAMSKALDLPISEVKELLIDYERRQNPKEENEKTLWEKVEPHPDPVLLQQVLDDLCEYISAYVVLEPYYVCILALWVVMTWVFDKFDRLPILLVTSPAPRSGKTTLFEILLKVVNRGLSNNDITPASIFRTIEKYHPTLFIDEADTLLRDNEDLTRIINGAHDSESRVTRCDPETNEPRAYNCFAPVALAGNNPVMAPATRDRCIEIKLKRKLRDDNSCGRARKRQVKSHAKELLPYLVRAVQDIAPSLETMVASLTSDFHFSELDDLDDRAYDCVEPLAIIALVADQQASGNGGKGAWFQKAVSAIKTVVANRTETETKHIQLLRDIKTVFDQTQQDALPSKELLTKLKQLDESPWDDLTERTLAKVLKPFEVKPELLRFKDKDKDKVARGYRRQSFEDPWKRYL